MERTFLALFIVILITVFLAGCGEADMEGIVLETNEHGIKLATELSLDEYEEIKNESAKEIQNQDVCGGANLGLIDLTYDYVSESDFDKGDEVEVWIDGTVLRSYPGSATAEKITIKP